MSDVDPGLCRGSGASMGGTQGATGRGRKVTCPVCRRRIAMRPGRAGRLYPHRYRPADSAARGDVGTQGRGPTDPPMRAAVALVRRGAAGAVSTSACTAAIEAVDEWSALP